MSKQEVIICHNLEENLNKAINQCPHDKLFVLADAVSYTHLTLPTT